MASAALHWSAMAPAPANDEPLRRGKLRRKQVARGDLGLWSPKRRKQSPLLLLKQASRGRVESLLPLKAERMSASPFAYFRGAAPVMAYDLSLAAHTGILCQLCGDAHVQNLGAFAGEDGRLIFDINDFDETTRGPFEWDVKRMATSILLAGEEAGVKAAGCTAAAEAFLRAYCGLVHRLSCLPVLEVARFQVHGLLRNEPVSEVLRKAERATPLHSRDRLTIEEKGKRVFASQPPTLRRVRGEERRSVLASLSTYRKSLAPERRHFVDQLQPLDVGFKVVGIGSVGMRDYCLYLQGNGPNDPVFLQIKQESASAYAPYLPKAASAELHQGQRVVDGQRAMQVQSDPLLGWTSFGGHDYLVRQLKDHKASLDVTALEAEGLEQYAQVCGQLLAHGHARSGDARLMAGYLGSDKRFTAAMLEFAQAYADQTATDWKQLAGSQETH